MAVLLCEEVRDWIEEEIEHPVKRRVRKTREECRKKKRWWKRLWCTLKVYFLEIVDWVVEKILKEVVYRTCKTLDLGLTHLATIGQRAFCVLIATFFSWIRPQSRDRVEHVFVLMLENRSFDHMLGYSGIVGRDARTGQSRAIDGITGSEGNAIRPGGAILTVSAPAPLAIDGDEDRNDPSHEFADVYLQLTGQQLPAELTFGAVAEPRDWNYPDPTNSGFLMSYVGKIPWTEVDPAERQTVLKCFGPEQLPVLTSLATEFAVCDRWFSSMPGPTWPNRMFAHAASSGRMDDSPSVAGLGEWYLSQGFAFRGGTIFDRLNSSCRKWEIFAGDELPQVLSLETMELHRELGKVHPALGGLATMGRVSDFAEFASRLSDPNYDASYVFVEPHYGQVASNFHCGNSQHPLDTVTRGEQLIKDVYEIIRNSPHWERSLLIITWDEHGGFYDHVPPPPSPPPGDGRGRTHNFGFDRYGPRVPAVVVSPLIPKGVVDHDIHDHASIPRTVEDLFGLQPLTDRDATAIGVAHLLTLERPRETPTTLPNPLDFSDFICVGFAPDQERSEYPSIATTQPGTSTSSVGGGRSEEAEPSKGDSEIPPDLAGFLYVAYLRHLAEARKQGKEVAAEVVRNFRSITTRRQARHYVEAIATSARLRNPSKLMRGSLRSIAAQKKHEQERQP